MESLRNEPVIFGGTPGGTGYGGHDVLSTVLLASLLGGRGLGAPYAGAYGAGAPAALGATEALSGVTAFNASETRRDIKDVESEIRESIHNQTNTNSAEFRTVGMKLCDIEKENVETKYALSGAIKDSENRLTNKIDRESDQIKNQMRSFETNMDKQFCDLNMNIERKFCELKERELTSRISQLEGTISAQKDAIGNTQVINTILGALNVATPIPRGPVVNGVTSQV